ncbi:hypothetical protein KKF91_05835, partial [Myxococcota bacterium]|nr:hypothetical protein [Myxococcota bacterium]
MKRALNVEALRARDACAEGISWLEARGGRLSLEGPLEEAALEAPGFAAWGFFHMPELRDALGEARLLELAGPRHAALSALFDDLRAATFLTSAGADEVIQGEVEAHLRALSALPVKLGLTAPVAISRVSLTDAWGLCPPSEEGLPTPPPSWIASWWAEHAEAAGAAPASRRRRGADPRVEVRAWLWSELAPIQPIAEWVGRFIGAAAFRAAFRGARRA